MKLLDFNIQVAHEVRAPICTPAEGLELYHRATMKYRHVLKKLRNITPDAELPISDILLGYNRVAGVPQRCNLHRLFHRFNDIARANFVAHPDLDDEVNALIFYYGIDQLHTVNIHLHQSYFNIVLAVFTMASNLAGIPIPKFQNSAHLWVAYIFAWIESITERGDDDFAFREEFLQQWRRSKYDLTLFTQGQRRSMNTVLHEFKDGKPPVEGDPIEFLHKCRMGVFNGKEFERVGIAMALHWILAQLKLAKEEKEEKMEGMRRVAEEKVMRAAQAEEEDEQDESDGDEEGDDMDVDMGEDEDDVEGDDDEEDEEVDVELVNDEMEVDIEGLDPIPEDMDLTRIEWDADWMESLLNIDMAIEWKEGVRPKSDRMDWIDPTQGFDAIFTRGDYLAEQMKKWLNITE